MGAGLAKAAYAAANALELREHAPVRLFVFMALTARDGDSPPSFYGGRESLAHALAAPGDATGYRSVKKAVSSLTSSGLIALRTRPGRGRRAQYDLLDGRGGILHIGDPSEVPVDEPRPELETPQGSVNKSVRGPLKSTLGTPEGPFGDPSGVPLGGEEDEEETRASAPPRSCTRHSSWEHSQPCRACANDRRAAELHSVARTPDTMSPRIVDCGPGKHKPLPGGTCMLCEFRDPLWEVA